MEEKRRHIRTAAHCAMMLQFANSLPEQRASVGTSVIDAASKDRMLLEMTDLVEVKSGSETIGEI